MTTTEIERHTAPGALAVSSGQTEWTPAQLAALVQLGVGDAPLGDQQVFLHQAQRTGLDPFTRQIHMIGRNQKNPRTNQWETKYTVQTGIDGFRVIAQRNPNYGGPAEVEWCGKDGVWRDVWLSQEPPAAARATVWRRDWDRPCRAVAIFTEYAGTTKDGELTRMWREKGALMIGKCAEALAMRKAYPHDLSGIYTADEMTQADQAATPAAGPERPAEAPSAPARGGRAEPGPTRDWDGEMASAIAARDLPALKQLYREAKGLLDVRERLTAAATALKDQLAVDEPDEPVDAEVVDLVDQRQHAHMHALWNKAELTDRDERLAITSYLVGEHIPSSVVLTREQADSVIARLRAADERGELAQQVDQWLAEAYAPVGQAPEDPS